MDLFKITAVIFKTHPQSSSLDPWILFKITPVIFKIHPQSSSLDPWIYSRSHL